MPANLGRALNDTVPTHWSQGGEIPSWYAKAYLKKQQQKNPKAQSKKTNKPTSVVSKRKEKKK